MWVGKREGIQSSAVGLLLSQDQEMGWMGTRTGWAPHLSKAFLMLKILLSHCCFFSLPCILQLSKGAGTKGIC